MRDNTAHRTTSTALDIFRHGVALVAAGLFACGPTGPPTFKRVQSEVFDVSCATAGCHKGPAATGGLHLEAPAYAKLVNAATHDFDGGVLVVPGQPDQSYLYTKLTADQPPLGQRMPPLSPLEPGRLGLVRDWISQGAQND